MPETTDMKAERQDAWLRRHPAFGLFSYFQDGRYICEVYETAELARLQPVCDGAGDGVLEAGDEAMGRINA